MKRVKVASGWFVLISDELAEKAARIRWVTRAELDVLVAMAPKACSGRMLGHSLRHRLRRKRR